MKPSDLLAAHERGFLKLNKDTQFFGRRYKNDDLWRKGPVIPAGTTVHVDKTYRRGRAALVSHIDSEGKIWWAWKHATEADL